MINMLRIPTYSKKENSRGYADMNPNCITFIIPKDDGNYRVYTISNHYIDITEETYLKYFKIQHG